MFGRKKTVPSLVNEVDDNRSVVYDFICRIPYESYRPVEYRLYHELEEEEMIPKLDAYLEKLFAGDVDDANGDVLDSTIFAAARRAKPDLGRQHHNHGDMLQRLITRRKSDREDFVRIIQNRVHELEVLESEYGRTCRLYDRYHEEDC